MPTLDVSSRTLWRQIGISPLKDEEFDEICFEFGIERDLSFIDSTTKEAMYKFDISSNRYDLLCIEGLASNLKQFINQNPKIPIFRFSNPKMDSTNQNQDKKLRIDVEENTKSIRPHILGAILQNVNFNDENFKSFIDYQDKLHSTICRNRKNVSIGTHDLDKLLPPFRYITKKPIEINFQALKQTKSMRCDELIEILAKDDYLKNYLKILDGFDEFPFLLDSNNDVVSFPPIINGIKSKMSIETKNVFIEVTGTDFHRCQQTLALILANFSQYCQNKFFIKTLEIHHHHHHHHNSIEDPQIIRMPNKLYETYEIEINKINRTLGTNLDSDIIIKSLLRMLLPSSTNETHDSIQIQVPFSRPDILDQIDIIEEIAIGYGINKITPKIVQFPCTSSLDSMTRLTNAIRHELAQICLTEVLTFTLCSKSDISDKLMESFSKNAHKLAVTIKNPKTSEFQVIRTSLIPGLLKSIASNSRCKLPISIFEVSDVVHKFNDECIGAKNRRMVSIVICEQQTHFEHLHGILDRIMLKLDIPFSSNGYSLKTCQDDTYRSQAFIHNMSAEILFQEKSIGILGIISPFVLQKFDIKHPCLALEFDLSSIIES